MRKDDVTHPDDIAGDDEAIRELIEGQRDTFQREKRYFRADGQVVWARVSVALLPDGRGPTGIVHAEDMTTQKRAEKSLARQVLSDALTGLANRTALLDHLRLAIDQLERHPGYVAVLYVDLDRFKPVNDSLGHAAGDVVLRMVAGRLQLAVRGIDTVARVGGDEFVVVCPSVLDDEDAVKVARRIAETISDPIPINGERTVVTASIGIALGAAGNQDAEELMHAADVAMYQAKERGGHRFEIYDRDLADRAERRLEVEHDLRVALVRARQHLHYQPIIDLANGDTVGAEALLRIGHPSRGTIDAAEFIDVAEDIGITVDLGDWILHEACRQLAAWRDLTGADLQVSVNVSGRQAAQANIADLVASATAAAGISPGRLSLEFTETILLEAGHSMRHDLHTLAGKGIHLVLDDFGTGYTSLTHVKQFPVDGVKIDRSLVSGVANERESRAVVAAIVTLCRGLGITATAVGVETAQQLAALREMGCHRAQGYHIARPQPPNALLRSLTLRSERQTRSGYG